MSNALEALLDIVMPFRIGRFVYVTRMGVANCRLPVQQLCTIVRIDGRKVAVQWAEGGVVYGKEVYRQQIRFLQRPVVLCSFYQLLSILLCVGILTLGLVFVFGYIRLINYHYQVSTVFNNAGDC
jgi:hypothetical protein